MKTNVSLWLLLLIALVICNHTFVHAHDDHEHTEEDETETDVHVHDEEEEHTKKEVSSYEASSIWELGNEAYALSFCTGEADMEGMIVVLLPLTSTDETDVNSTTEWAETIATTFSSEEVIHRTVTSGSELNVKANTLNSTNETDVLYRVDFAAIEAGSSSRCVVVNVPIPAAGLYMLFMEHATEEVNVHFLNLNNEEITLLQCVTGCEEDHDHAEHEEEEESSSESSSGWTSPIVASVVISLTSLVGVAILTFYQGDIDRFVEYMASFAAGCLLGVVVFHLYPEGTEYLAGQDEWVMGTCVLGGVTFSILVEQGVHFMLSSFGVDHHCDTHNHGPNHNHHEDQAEKQLVVNSESDPATVTTHSDSHHATLNVGMSAYQAHPATPRQELNNKSTVWAKYVTTLKFVEPVAWITAVGDFFHAFTDGVVMAVAFKSCSSSLGWAVAFGIVLHEVPHRVGDFFIFLKAGMVVVQALVINFLASLASLLGVVILLAAGEVSGNALGAVLGVGAGALLFIAMAELLPPMLSVRDRKRAMVHFCWFAFGCVLIGLSTLQHKHCDAETGEEHTHSH